MRATVADMKHIPPRLSEIMKKGILSQVKAAENAEGPSDFLIEAEIQDLLLEWYSLEFMSCSKSVSSETMKIESQP